MAGAALGVACLVRADVLLGALVLVAGIGGRAPGGRPARGPGLRAGAAALAGLLLLLAPWTVFASRRAHAFVPITDGGSSTLFIATYLPGHGTIFGLKHALHAELVRRHPRYRHVPIQRISSRAFLNTVAQRHPGLGHDAAISAALRHNLRVYVLGHPVAFAKLTATKIGRMWGQPFRGSHRHATAGPLWAHRVLLALALLGLLGGLWRRRTAPLVLVALALLVIAAVERRVRGRGAPRLPADARADRGRRGGLGRVGGTPARARVASRHLRARVHHVPRLRPRPRVRRPHHARLHRRVGGVLGALRARCSPASTAPTRRTPTTASRSTRTRRSIPGVDGPQAMRSVAMHLMRLCLVYERGMAPGAGRAIAPRLLSQPPDVAWLEPPADRGAVTVADVAAAAGPDEHLVRVDDWGRCVWSAWSAHHATVRRWLDASLAPA